MSDYVDITEYGDYRPMPGEDAVTVPCPACGAVVRFSRGYWARTTMPEQRHRGDGMHFSTVTITGIYCHECKAISPVRDWHARHEARVIAAAGFVTGRMMKTATVTA